MATITTKKHARYVRDSDGVYRRKTDDEIVTTTNTKSGHEELVNELINELMDCGQIEVPLVPVRPPPNPETHQQTGPGAPTGAPSSHTAPSHTTSAAAMNVAPSERSAASGLTRLFALPKIPDLFSMAQTQDLLQKYPVERILGWVIPFVLGMATMYVLEVMKPTLLHYGAIAARGMTLVLLYGVFALGVLWYAGVIKLASLTDWHSSTSKSALGMLGRNSAPEQASLAPTSPISPTAQVRPRLADPGDVASINSSVPSVLSRERPVERVASARTVEVRPFIPPIREKSPEDTVAGRPRMPRVSTDIKDPKQKMRSRFSPIRLSKEGRRHSSASLGGYSDPYRDTRDQFRDGRGNDMYGDSKKLHRGSRESVSSPAKFYKPLPPVIKMAPENHTHEADLPLVYEVQLKSMEQEDPEYDALKRLGTLMSKQSVLGTRANYLKFLSNVDD